MTPCRRRRLRCGASSRASHSSTPNSTPRSLPPRGPLHKLRNGFYPPRHASRRSVLAVAASMEAMQGAPWRQSNGDRSGLLALFFGSAPSLLSSSCLSLAAISLGAKVDSCLLSLRATAPEALCSPFRASRRRARLLLGAYASGQEPRRARWGATRAFTSR